MGIPKLYELLNDAIVRSSTHVSNVCTKNGEEVDVCVDGNWFMYKGLRGYNERERDNADSVPDDDETIVANASARAFVDLLTTVAQYVAVIGRVTVYFDGSSPEIKRWTQQRRREDRERQQRTIDMKRVRDAFCVHRSVVSPAVWCGRKRVRVRLHVLSAGESEHELVMRRRRDEHVHTLAVTGDSDLIHIAYGLPRVHLMRSYRDAMCIRMDAMAAVLRMPRIALSVLCAVCGSDVTRSTFTFTMARYVVTSYISQKSSCVAPFTDAFRERIERAEARGRLVEYEARDATTAYPPPNCVGDVYTLDDVETVLKSFHDILKEAPVRAFYWPRARQQTTHDEVATVEQTLELVKVMANYSLLGIRYSDTLPSYFDIQKLDVNPRKVCNTFNDACSLDGTQATRGRRICV